jgi:hypothetical protein
VRACVQVASNPIFKDTPIFVFLNKKDLFEQMVSRALHFQVQLQVFALRCPSQQRLLKQMIRGRHVPLFAINFECSRVNCSVQ